jgi:hypothetical protein
VVVSLIARCQVTLGTEASPLAAPGSEPSEGITSTSWWCQPTMVSTSARLLKSCVLHLAETS